jgi:hypothetical protein
MSVASSAESLPQGGNQEWISGQLRTDGQFLPVLAATIGSVQHESLAVQLPSLHRQKNRQQVKV